MTQQRNSQETAPDGEWSDNARQSIFRRYREDVPAATKNWNPTLELILAHRSIRAFLPDPLPEGALETIVAAAQSAPTSSNGQSWSVVAVGEPERKSRLAALTGGQRYVAEAPVFLVWVADLARIELLAGEHNLSLDALAFTDTFVTATIDCALAAQNAVVAAESLGLGILYVGAIRNNPEKVAIELGLPPNSYAVFGMSLGYADPAVGTAVKPRLPQPAVFHRETYSYAAQREAITRHDGHMRDFRLEQGLDGQSWFELTSGRLAKVESLNGRHVLRDVLNALGFRLR